MTTEGFFQLLITRYDQALLSLPDEWRGPASLILVLAIAGGIWHAIRKSGLWLALLVFLVPALVPTLRNVGIFVIALLRALVDRASL